MVTSKASFVGLVRASFYSPVFCWSIYWILRSNSLFRVNELVSNSNFFKLQFVLPIQFDRFSHSSFITVHRRRQSEFSDLNSCISYRSRIVLKNPVPYERLADSIVKSFSALNMQTNPMKVSLHIDCCLPMEFNLILRVSSAVFVCMGNWIGF